MHQPGFNEKMLYIHIGMPKTGSSAIQAFLALNFNKLKSKGVLFPNPPQFEQAFQTSGGNVRSLKKLFSNNDINTVKDLVASLCTGNAHTIILSSEALFHSLRNHPDRFFEVFGRYNFRIICYVRRQDDLIASSYNQSIKYLDTVAPLGSLTEEFARAHDFSKTLFNSLKYTDKGNIIVRPYEKQQFYENNIFSDFLNCIGLKLDNSFIFPEPIVNPSLSPVALEFRRVLNLMRVDRRNMILKRYINSLLAQYTVANNMGKPFQSNNAFTTTERIAILNRHNAGNQKVARTFLHRENGQLFYDTIPNTDRSFAQEATLTYDKALDICKYFLTHCNSNANSDSSLIDAIIRGTVEKVSRKAALTDEEIQDKPLIYSLESKPVSISKDILSMEKKFGVWCIEAGGTDPAFIIPAFDDKHNDGILFIKICITASVDTLLQLFYKTDNHRFDINRMATGALERGYNEFILKITAKEPIKQLRLDPGCREGIYLLHTFEIRGGIN